MKPTKTQNGQDRKRWFEQIMHDQQAGLVRYTYSLTHDVERARDIVQEAFLKLWDDPSKNVDAYCAPWLFTVCRNRAIDIQRKESKMQSLNPVDQGRLVDKTDNPETALQKRQEQAVLPALLAQLTKGQQEFVRLKFESELSYKEIAEVTGHSVSNVGVQLHNAIKKLRQLHTIHTQNSAGGLS